MLRVLLATGNWSWAKSCPMPANCSICKPHENRESVMRKRYDTLQPALPARW